MFFGSIWAMNESFEKKQLTSEEKVERLKSRRLNRSDLALNAVALVNAQNGLYSARSPRSPHLPPQHVPPQDSPTTRLAIALIEGGKNIEPLLRPLEINRPVDEESNTCLHLACLQNNKAAVESILTVGNLDVNAQNINSETPLHVAAMFGFSEIVSMLLDHQKILPNLANKQGDTALHLAAKNLKKECLQVFLLSLKVDKDALNHVALKYWDYCRKDKEVKALVKETLKIRKKMLAQGPD